MDFGDYLDYSLAEQYTHLSNRTLKRAVSNRELTHIKQGRRTLFRRNDLDTWMDRKRVKAVL